LVRSAIVEIKEEIAEKNGRPPKHIIFSAIYKEKDSEDANIDIAANSETEREQAGNQIERDAKLETVQEHPNEVTIEVKT
jgi:hypothetical protein